MTTTSRTEPITVEAWCGNAKALLSNSRVTQNCSWSNMASGAGLPEFRAPLHSAKRSGTHPTMSLLPNNMKESTKARLMLLVVCLWPLIIMAMFASSAAGRSGNNTTTADGHPGGKIPVALQLRSLLDRVDVLGYGPTHPRVAIVVTGSDTNLIAESVESVFQNTDLDRLFMICAVADGLEARDHPKFVETLSGYDSGNVPHWHGGQAHLHYSKDVAAEEIHSKKVQVIWNPQKQGIASSRSDAVAFVQILAKKHENAGLKSPNEDLILVLLQEGALLLDNAWLPLITSALIVPTPLHAEKDATVALKLANAVSFSPITKGGIFVDTHRTTFDFSFRKGSSDASAADMALSNGESYPTPALQGLATAIRLETFLALPSQDLSLKDAWAADLNLSMNLWLCADGIDILQGVNIVPPGHQDAIMRPTEALDSSQAARFVAAWMEQDHGNYVYNKFSDMVTRLQWEVLVSSAKQTPTFSAGLQNKCRSFAWYASEINTDLPNIKEMNVGEGQEPVVEKPSSMKPKTIDNHPPIHLSDENLGTIRKSTPVDLTFKHVSDGHKEHPHMGAKDEKGNWGYVHDVTSLKRNPPAFRMQLSPNELEKACSKRGDNYKMLTQKVSVDIEGHREAEKSKPKRDKILCLIYTLSSGHSKIPPIRETWGQKCDGFMVASNLTDASIDAVEIPHEGPEEYKNIFQKVRSIWSYVYDNYYEDYDWFHIGGDDLYVIIENLRLYLESDEIRMASNGGASLPNGDETTQTPLFIGRRFDLTGGRWNDQTAGKSDEIFISGGSGYTMNKATLKTLVAEGFTNYFPHAHDFSEDTINAKILKKFGIEPYDARDEKGSERYMPFTPSHHYSYKPPADPSTDWYIKYSIGLKLGLDHCAAHSVAFHYITSDLMKQMHATLYHLCPWDKESQ